jgi:integrase
MRLEATAKPDEYQVWMTDAELDALRRAAANHRDDLILQLGGYVGLRAFEIPQIHPEHVKRTPDGDHYRLRVPEGKDTTGSGGKPRDAYLPRDVEAAIHRYQSSEGIARDEPLIDLTERGVRAVVKRTAERAAEETGVDDYQHVSSHDLRRRFAQRLLVDEQVNPRVVMVVGGWDSFQAIEPYLNAPAPEVVNKAFEEAGLA